MPNVIEQYRVSAEYANLDNIDVDLIHPNPDNPRLIFRPTELEELLASIEKHGVQVPISVYEKGRKYVLIDGERRWTCCQKLGRKTIPALIQNQPDPLTNLLLMFNIHALREQWDLLTIAMKLPKVIELYIAEEGHTPNERELSETTGLQRGVIRRCKYLLGLPEKYRNMIMEELKKPKNEQKLTEDFFIEMERSLKTVERVMPNVLGSKDSARRVLIRKYRNGTIANVLDLRLLPKMAKADKVEADVDRAIDAIQSVFYSNEVGIREAFENSVSGAYSEQDIISRMIMLAEKLKKFDRRRIDKRLREQLRVLVDAANELLGARR